jgi:hypothetical protein
VFPEAISAPPLVPEAIDEKAPAEIPAGQVTGNAPTRPAGAVERVTVSEHFLLLKMLAMYRPPRRGQSRERAA